MLYKYFNKTGESGSVYIGYNHNMMVTPTLPVRRIAMLCHDCQRTSKSFAARPCNRPCAAKHMLFCLPGLRRLDNFIIPRQLLPVSGLYHLDNFIIT